MTKRPSAYPVRLSADLKEWLESRSIRNFRSMNAELVAILTTIRDGEANGSGLEKFANPSGTGGTTPLFGATSHA